MSLEVVLFLVVALLAGGLTMGGITLVYFLDKWRSDPEVPPVGRHDPGDVPTPDRRPRAHC